MYKTYFIRLITKTQPNLKRKISCHQGYQKTSVGTKKETSSVLKSHRTPTELISFDKITYGCPNILCVL